jgi:peptidoglycan/LPS O-acetylase OafA/YrhL
VRPELPYLAAGAVAITAGFVRERGWPAEGTGAVVGTLILVVVASATSGTAIAPLVRALGLLLLMAAIFAAVPAFQAARKTKKGVSSNGG